MNNVFYKDIYQKYRKKGALVENGWTLLTFTIECLESDHISPHKMFLGIEILNSTMGQDTNNHELLSIMNTSTNALLIWIKMVGNENPQHIHMRLFASKVLWHVAPNIKSYPPLLWCKIHKLRSRFAIKLSTFVVTKNNLK